MLFVGRLKVSGASRRMRNCALESAGCYWEREVEGREKVEIEREGEREEERDNERERE